MAIDSRAKRFNMLAFGGGDHTLPEADAGAIEADDRAHLLDLYGGNALAAPADKIDSRAKRFNMLAFGGGEIIHILPEADAGAIEADDRALLLGLYGGNALDAAGGDGTDLPWPDFTPPAQARPQAVGY